MKREDPLAAIPDDELRPKERPRAVQYFSDEYLERCRRLSAEDIVQFLEEYRLNYAAAEAARKQGASPSERPYPSALVTRVRSTPPAITEPS